MNNQNIYPNIKFDEPNITNSNDDEKINTQSQTNFDIQKILPAIISGKGLTEILPNLIPQNPMLSSIMSLSKSKNIKTEKIKSDIIDVSSLHKIH